MVKILLIVMIAVIVSITPFSASWTDELVAHENTHIDFDISICDDGRVIKSIELKPAPNTIENSTSDTEIDKFYGKFALCPPSEKILRGSQPSAGADLSASRNRDWRTYRPAGEDTIHYDGENYDYIGLFYGGTIEGAIRLTPMELGPYNDWNLTSVRFYHGTGSSTGMLKIYGQGTSYSPGALISTEPYSVSAGGWLTIDLSSPVTINASQDIWVSRTATHSAGTFPLGIDAGPAVTGKGDWVYDDGVWIEMYLPPFFDFNWNIRAIVTSPVGIEDDTHQVPIEFALKQNFPNPFNRQTRMSYELPKSSKVSLGIYNIKGQLVETLVNEVQLTGNHSVIFDSNDMIPGIYLYRIIAGDFIDTKKCIILK